MVMFSRLGNFIAKHWILVILAWLVVAVALRFVAPRWDDVTHDGDFEHLPAEVISVRGAELLHRAFPATRAKSQMVVVVARDDAPLESSDLTIVDTIAAAFAAQQTSGALPILDIWTHESEVVGRMLTSDDEQATLVVLQLDNDLMATDNIRVLSEVRALLAPITANTPAGLQFGVTGSAAIGGDMLDSAAESVSNTHISSLLLVIAILFAVYRAPLLVAVPLIAIALSVTVSFDLIALATQLYQLPGMDWWTYKIFKTTKIFVVVILYGAGTDFCLFLIARYKEELSQGHSAGQAVARALGAVGAALAASALTTILGLAMMFFADFGKFSYSGPTIALALVVALLASTTLAPAVLVALGRAVFWPASRKLDSPRAQGYFVSFWEWSSHKILARPGLILISAMLLMAPLAYAGMSVGITYDLLSELRSDRPSVQGTQLLRRHFSAGETGPLTVLAYREAGGFDEKEGEREIARLTKLLYDLPGVSRVRSLAEPTGDSPGKTQLFSTSSLIKLAAKQHPLTKATFVTQVEELQGRVARFELVMQHDPFSSEAIEVLERVEARLAALHRESPVWQETRFQYAGTTAGIRDLRDVTQSDSRIIQQLVVIAVLAVLLMLLRHPLICIYLILSVLWSYFVTIGATEWYFAWLYGPSYHGLDWKVPIFLFVILIAVGQDYNIYLTTRVFEEQQRHGPLEGLRKAIVCTGGIITSCGVIMAGTFVSMMTGTLRGMLELGFALSLGVLLDTFVVRTVLVPAFLALLAKRQLRRHRSLAEPPPTTKPHPAPALKL